MAFTIAFEARHELTEAVNAIDQAIADNIQRLISDRPRPSPPHQRLQRVFGSDEGTG